jgi:hypothetical protein
MPFGYRKNSPPPQNLDEIAHFIVEVRLIADRLSDGGPQQLTVTLPQPVHGNFDRTFAHAQSLRDLLAGQLIFPREACLERIELFALAGPRQRFAAPIRDRREVQDCPTAAIPRRIGPPGRARRIR